MVERRAESRRPRGGQGQHHSGRATPKVVKGPQFEPLADVLQRVTGEGGLARGLREQAVLQGWPQIVGAVNARHSRALGFKDGVLWIQTESSVWAQELSLLRPQIQKALERSLGEGSVREIRFRTGTLHDAPWER